MNRLAVHRPKGPSSLSPAQRAGCDNPMNTGGCGNGIRSHSIKKLRGIKTYRAPLGRMNICVARDPGRCPGLRNVGPLGRGCGANDARFPSAAQKGMKELEGMLR